MLVGLVGLVLGSFGQGNSQKIGELMAALDRRGQFCGSVVVAVRGRVLYRGGGWICGSQGDSADHAWYTVLLGFGDQAVHGDGDYDFGGEGQDRL